MIPDLKIHIYKLYLLINLFIYLFIYSKLSLKYIIQNSGYSSILA